jgi:hypothetical protein
VPGSHLLLRLVAIKKSDHAENHKQECRSPQNFSQRGPRADKPKCDREYYASANNILHETALFMYSVYGLLQIPQLPRRSWSRSLECITAGKPLTEAPQAAAIIPAIEGVSRHWSAIDARSHLLRRWSGPTAAGGRDRFVRPCEQGAGEEHVRVQERGRLDGEGVSGKDEVQPHRPRPGELLQPNGKAWTHWRASRAHLIIPSVSPKPLKHWGAGNISSKGDDDLPELAALLQIAVHFHYILELECTIDDRLERATRKALDNVLHCDLPACLVARY